MLLMHFVDLFWCVMPVLHHHGFHLGVLDSTTFVGIGGLLSEGIGDTIRVSITGPPAEEGPGEAAREITVLAGPPLSHMIGTAGLRHGGPCRPASFLTSADVHSGPKTP